MSKQSFSLKAVVGSFILGGVVTPMVLPSLKPLLREAAKTTIGLGLQMKRLANEAAADLQTVAAEAESEAAATRDNGGVATRPAAQRT